MTWEQRLRRARKAGEFSIADQEMVGAWPTCAIGEKFHVRTRGIAHMGLGLKVERLGIDFMHAVESNDVYTAVRIYDQIQRVEK